MQEAQPPAPAAPRALPLIGHAVPALRDPLRFLRTLPSYGDVVPVRIGPFRAVVVCDPELTRHVLVHDHDYDKGGPLYDRLREVLGNGVGTCPHADHRRQRRLVQPAFHPARMPAHTRAMAEQIGSAVGAWVDGQALDARVATLAVSSRVAVAAMFAAPLPPATRALVVDDLTVVMRGMYRRLLVPARLKSLPLMGTRRYDRARARLRRTTHRIIDDYRTTGTDHGDLLSMLLAAPDDDAGSRGGALSDAEVCDQILTFFLAAIEGNANVLAWALHLTARDPALQDRLRAEADAVLGEAGPSRLDGCLERLELTARVIAETMRLFPPGWMLTRTTTKPAVLGGHHIPAGTTVVFSPYLIHRREDLYADAARFDPDRWKAGESTLMPSTSFIPFGGGARKCIGDVFGMTEATLSLAMTLRTWTVEPATARELRPAPNIQLSPDGPLLRVRAVKPS